MAENKNNPVDVEKLLRNKLKQISISELEEKIAQAVSDLVGEDYKCTINDIKYTLFSGADLNLKIELSYKAEE